MGAGTNLLLSLVWLGIALYALFFVVRAGVEAGIRRALPDAALRPEEAAPRSPLPPD